MKMLVSIILLLVLTACNTKPSDKPVHASTPNSLTNKKTSGQSTAICQIDTLQINGYKFIRSLKGNKFNCLLTLTGDTVIKSEDFYFEMKLLDIDEDGYKDIRVFILSNIPNQCDNYLFDKTFNTFRKIQNSDLDIVKIKNTKYFYSYNSVGCGDSYWESHLSKIEKWEEINIGLMSVRGCGNKDDAIQIFTINYRTGMKLVKTLPIIIFNNNATNNKWVYLKTYWEKNYALFE